MDDKRMKQPSLFNKQELRGRAIRFRNATGPSELTDGDLFPFGSHKKAGRKMMEVPLTYLRWFLTWEVRHKFPAVLKYAENKLGPQREQVEQFTRARHLTPRTIAGGTVMVDGSGRVRGFTANAPAAKSDPVAAQAAFEAFKAETAKLRQ